MKHYIGFILTIFSIVFILNSGCSKESGIIVPDIVIDTTYTDTTVIFIDTLDNPIDTIQDSTDVAGCTDSTALNYNSLATINDGSCQYATVEILGCTDLEADNFNAEATVDDGSCEYPGILGCTDPAAENFNPAATLDDGTCEYPVQITGDVGDIFSELGGSNINSTGETSYAINNDFSYFIQGPKGVRLFVDPNIFETLSGVPVTGEVEISLIEVLTKGDMIRYQIPTFSMGQLLESGGMLHISVTQNGQELRLRSGRTIGVQVPSETISNEMSVFYGDENTEPLDWTIADSTSIFLSEWEDSLGLEFGYELLADRLGWINCDYFYGESNLTDAAVSLGGNYSNQNAVVFMVFNDINSVAQMWGDPNTMQFHSGNIPIGYNVTFIVIASLSEDENNPEYEFALVPATIGPNHLEEIVPMPATLAEIEAALDNL